MKKLILVLMAVGLFGAMPALAANHDMVKKDAMKECVLVSDTIQEKIKRYEEEIAKGEKKADPKALKKLKLKLDEANKLLKQMYEGP